METRLIVTAVLTAMCLSGRAQQQTEEGARAGLLQATASFYPSRMLNRNVRNNYIAGHAAYYVDDRYSFRGDALVYIDAQGDDKVFRDHVQVQGGFGRHFAAKRWDPYVYGQMGLAAIRMESSEKRYYQPVAGITAGTNYHVSRFFYFFAECSYSHVQHPERTGNLDQLFVSGGLGFQLAVRD